MKRVERMEPGWEKMPLNGGEVRALAKRYGLDLLVASIFVRRGMAEGRKMRFFLEDGEFCLHNPFLFSQMERMVERLLEAAEQGERVFVFGDKDADGITATVLMLESLEFLGLEADWHVPVGGEDYGLNEAVIRKKAEEGCTLFVTVDCGITDFGEIGLASELGMDVLVLDHHMPRGEELPSALAIVNPKLDRSYPFDGLSAAALVSKLQWALCLGRTDLFGKSFGLILAHRDGGELCVEACKVRNLVVSSFVSVSSSGSERDYEGFLRFIEGVPLFTYGVEEQMPLISGFFGGAEIYVVDFSREAGEVFPALRGVPLEGVRAMSRFARYYPDEGGGMRVLVNLFVAMHERRLCDAFEHWRCGLDLVAVGILADMMPLVDENRVLVSMGLERVNLPVGRGRRAVRELMIRQGVHERRVYSMDISWKISPLINACGRLGQADMGVEFLRERDEEGIVSLAGSLMDLNERRRGLCEESWRRLLPAMCESLEVYGGRMAIVADSGTPRGITGILASRLQKTKGCNTVVIAVDGGKASGSIRCGADLNAIDWLNAVSVVLDDYGGHPRAGGFSLSVERMGELEELSRRWVRNVPRCVPEVLKVDAELGHGYIGRLGFEGLLGLVDRFEPYGEGFRPFRFLTRGVKVEKAELVGRPDYRHLRMQVVLGGVLRTALWWDGAVCYPDMVKPGGYVDMVYELRRDYWRGNYSMVLTVLAATLGEEGGGGVSAQPQSY